jgi:hypothetical protein
VSNINKRQSLPPGVSRCVWHMLFRANFHTNFRETANGITGIIHSTAGLGVNSPWSWNMELVPPGGIVNCLIWELKPA